MVEFLSLIKEDDQISFLVKSDNDIIGFLKEVDDEWVFSVNYAWMNYNTEVLQSIANELNTLNKGV